MSIGSYGAEKRSREAVQKDVSNEWSKYFWNHFSIIIIGLHDPEYFLLSNLKRCGSYLIFPEIWFDVMVPSLTIGNLLGKWKENKIKCFRILHDFNLDF